MTEKQKQKPTPPSEYRRLTPDEMQHQTAAEDIHRAEVDTGNTDPAPLDMGKDRTSNRPAEIETDRAQPPRTSTPAQDAGTQEGKPRRKTTTSAKVIDKYISKTYDKMTLQIMKGDKERLQAAAAALDISATALIIEAVNAYCNDMILTPKQKNPYI